MAFRYSIKIFIEYPLCAKHCDPGDTLVNQIGIVLPDPLSQVADEDIKQFTNNFSHTWE